MTKTPPVIGLALLIITSAASSGRLLNSQRIDDRKAKRNLFPVIAAILAMKNFTLGEFNVACPFAAGGDKNVVAAQDRTRCTPPCFQTDSGALG